MPFRAIREEATVKQPGLDNRNRDEDGEIRKKRSYTHVRTLRG